jgi:hypothetical protein
MAGHGKQTYQELYAEYRRRNSKVSNIGDEEIRAAEIESLMAMWADLRTHPDAPPVAPFPQPEDYIAVRLMLLEPANRTLADQQERLAWWDWWQSGCLNDHPPTEDGELQRLACVLKWRRAKSGKDASDPPGDNGPIPGNRFRFNGQVHAVAPLVWRLLSAMWQHDSRDVRDVNDEVWDVANEPEDAGRKLRSEVNSFLGKIGYPRQIFKARREETLYWDCSRSVTKKGRKRGASGN